MAKLIFGADDAQLEREHTPRAIRERIAGAGDHSYLRDGVLGGIDGAVTTFAVVCGVVGGQLPGAIVVLMGLANLLADGLSMAVGNYEGTRSQRGLVERARRIEQHHIEHVPDREVEEVREIFRRKGFEGQILEDIAEVITSNRELWLDTMVTEEWGLPLEGPDPLRAGLVTFGAFCLAGLVPLAPYLFAPSGGAETFVVSVSVTCLTFFVIGVAKGHLTSVSRWRTGLSTLLIGSLAAASAFGVGYLLRGIVDKV